MKKIIITCFSALVSMSLISCSSVNSVERAGGQVLSTGVKTGGNVLYSGVRVVSTAGSAVGTTVGGVLDTSFDLLTGKSVTKRDMRTYQKKGLVQKNGHTYKVQNGKYVLVR